MRIPMGVYDAPQRQEQPILYVDPYRNNIAVFGGPMTGKTTFIRTLLVRLHEDQARKPGDDIYIIDFGGNLSSYGNLGDVCACFNNSNEENIKRVFRTIDKRMEENAKALNGNTFYPLYRKDPGKCPRHLFLIIENVTGFLTDERYASYQERLQRLCRDGLSRGLTVVVTANDTSGLGRMMGSFAQKVVFDLPPEAYFDIFGQKVTQPMSLPGRGVANVESEPYEFQCFLPFADENEIETMVQETRKRPNPNRMVVFEDLLTKNNLDQFRAPGVLPDPHDGQVVVGLDYYEHRPVTVSLPDSRSIGIYGKRRFGKTNLLSLLMEGIRAWQPQARCVYLDDGRRQLQGFYDADCLKKRDAQYFMDVTALREYLADNSYGGTRSSAGGGAGRSRPAPKPAPEPTPAPAKPVQTPFTAFILQGKMLFQGGGDAKYLLNTLIPQLIGNAEAKGYLFIFSEVRNISDAEVRGSFQNSLSAAFLLDSIGDFVADKGSKSVFGEMDAKELKAEYAKCSVGDGFFYDIETDELKKLKFIRVDPDDAKR